MAVRGPSVELVASAHSVFGYAAVAGASGSRGIGTMLDLSARVRTTDWLTLGAYYAHVFGSGTIDRAYSDGDAHYAFVEATAAF